jgi:hypothetical protein
MEASYYCLALKARMMTVTLLYSLDNFVFDFSLEGRSSLLMREIYSVYGILYRISYSALHVVGTKCVHSTRTLHFL